MGHPVPRSTPSNGQGGRLHAVRLHRRPTGRSSPSMAPWRDTGPSKPRCPRRAERRDPVRHRSAAVVAASRDYDRATDDVLPVLGVDPVGMALEGGANLLQPDPDVCDADFMTAARSTIWERLQECVSTLSEPFRASEIIGWFRRHYPDVNETSLRAHIQYATSNVAERGAFASRPPLITRIDRGVYIRADTAASGVPPPMPALPTRASRDIQFDMPSESPDEAPGASSDADWHTEANVVGLVVRHLAIEGWSVRAVADTASKAHGIDIVASRDAETIGIEVKGYPGRHYADPRRAGQQKPTHPATQARVWYASAVVAGMKLRTKAPEMRSVLAFPMFQTYQGLYADTASSLTACGIEVWWVYMDGTVDTAIPSAGQA
jgi:hypothetical protein